MIRRDVVEQWLKDKKASTAGRSFDLIQNLDEAVDYFLGVWNDLDFAEQEYEVGEQYRSHTKHSLTAARFLKDPLPYA